MACTQANATSPEPEYWPPSVDPGSEMGSIDPVAVAPPGMLMLGIEVVSVGVDSVAADEDVAGADVVVELAVLLGSSSPFSRKNSRTPTPASTTTTAAMIQGRALF